MSRRSVLTFGLVAALVLAPFPLHSAQASDALNSWAPTDGAWSQTETFDSEGSRGDCMDGRLTRWVNVVGDTTTLIWATCGDATTAAALVNLTAFPLSGGLMPYIARDVFHLNQQGLGWMVASFASGAFIGSIGLMIAFYYGLTGFACTWFYRKNLGSNTRNLVMQGIIPLAGGTIMLVTFGYGLQQFLLPDWLTDDDGNNITIFGLGAVGVVGLLALVLGVVLLLVQRTAAPAFFRGETLPKRGSHDLVLAGIAGAGTDVHSRRLPDSGLPELIIAPDLSNLPEGQEAIDAVTGKKVTKPKK